MKTRNYMHCMQRLRLHICHIRYFSSIMYTIQRLLHDNNLHITKQHTFRHLPKSQAMCSSLQNSFWSSSWNCNPVCRINKWYNLDYWCCKECNNQRVGHFFQERILFGLRWFCAEINLHVQWSKIGMVWLAYSWKITQVYVVLCHFSKVECEISLWKRRCF